MYMEDVDDAIDVMLEDIAQLQQMAKSLQKSQEQTGDKRMQSTLFILSLVSATFLPMQFFSGVYGMNFVNHAGDPSMPELTMQNNYLFFWMLELGILMIVGGTFFVSFFCTAPQWCTIAHKWCKSCKRRRRHNKDGH